MARILYGVQGDAHGHAIRALTVARHYPEHEFLFVSHTRGAAFLRPSFRVLECPGPANVILGHRTASLPMLRLNLRFSMMKSEIEASLLRALDRFQPDFSITDYEFFVPRISRRLGIPCLSIDHQHIIACTSFKVPLRQLPGYLGLRLALSGLFSESTEYLVISFFGAAPTRCPAVYKVLPPILRESLLRIQPEDKGHVVSYQSTPTSASYLALLQSIGRPVAVYGRHVEGKEGNLHFKRYSEERFLEDLAGSIYVVCGGGHTLMSEALYLGKPVFSFPIAGLFEQYLNAAQLARLGYGRYATDFRIGPDAIRTFEDDLGRFRENIARGVFCGNGEVFSRLDCFFSHGTILGSPPETLSAPKATRRNG
jgi:uncharacterized protein (TIGR00661 family)